MRRTKTATGRQGRRAAGGFTGGLAALSADIARRGSRLAIRRGPSLDALRALVRETGARLVCYNRLYEPARLAADLAIGKALAAEGVEVLRLRGSSSRRALGGREPRRCLLPRLYAVCAGVARRPRRPRADRCAARASARTAGAVARPRGVGTQPPHPLGCRPRSRLDSRRGGCRGKARAACANAPGLRCRARSAGRRRDDAAFAAPSLRRNHPGENLARAKAPARGRRPGPSRRDRIAAARAPLARVRAPCPLPPPANARCAARSPLREVRMAKPPRRFFPPGSGEGPASRSWTPACANCGAPASCTTACA
ncbi:MAG: deoxyribodipyrimidine photo-lyase [Burkholderiales bacterium]|nr:deoxyribodipyrimidine photo-lyase [Burkholderiales bacterium]